MAEPLTTMRWKRVKHEYHLKLGKETVLTVWKPDYDPRGRWRIGMDSGVDGFEHYAWFRAKDALDACAKGYAMWREQTRKEVERLTDLLAAQVVDSQFDEVAGA